MSTQAITAVLDSLADAWAKGYADAYGAHFTKDASYITFVGTIYHGRTDIIESHRAPVREVHQGHQLSGEIADVRFYGPGTAVVTGRGENQSRAGKGCRHRPAGPSRPSTSPCKADGGIARD